MGLRQIGGYSTESVPLDWEARVATKPGGFSARGQPEGQLAPAGYSFASLINRLGEIFESERAH
jgi:hypothetical protein